MSIELVMGIVAVVLALVGGGAAWVRADQHGRTSEKLERAEEDVEDADARSKAASAAPARRKEASRILDRIARRARRVRDEASGRR